MVKEKVGEGVKRTEKKVNPMDSIPLEKKVRKSGVWKNATESERRQYEEDGVLIGYDKEKEQVLIKEVKGEK